MEFGGGGVQPREYKRAVQLPGSVAGEQESALQNPVMGHVILSKAKEGFKWRNPMIHLDSRKLTVAAVRDHAVCMGLAQSRGKH